MKKRIGRWGMATVLGLGLAAVGGGLSHPVAAAPSDAIFAPGASPTGYKLGLLAAACWMGGVWSDAEGAPPATWRDRDDQRCRDLVKAIYGDFSRARYEQIRENEARAVDDLLAKIRATEPQPTRERSVALFRDVAAAAHEGMLARRAADRVKIDYDASAVETKLTDDERRAAGALGAHQALDRLLIVPDKSAADRRAFGLLFALDRMEMARGLAKQLKFFALGQVLTTVFDVAPPPADVLKPNANPRPGAWLTYLRGVSTRAGYAVSREPSLNTKQQETLAWTGVGHGFADHLRQQLSSMPAAAVPELTRVISAVAARLDTERATAEALTKAHAAAQ